MIRVTRDITIDEKDLDIAFVRASGPGGQNVNKLSTAAQLRFDVNRVSLAPNVMTRLTALAGQRMTKEGIIVIHAQRFRTQERNRADAIDRLLELLRESLGDRELGGAAVLVRTGWATHWRTDHYFEGHPFLTEDAAWWLREANVALVGIDSYNIDDTEDGRRPVHTALLGAGIPIAEHLTNLDRLPRDGFRFSAAPVKVKGMGTFPVRAYAVVDR